MITLSPSLGHMGDGGGGHRLPSDAINHHHRWTGAVAERILFAWPEGSPIYSAGWIFPNVCFVQTEPKLAIHVLRMDCRLAGILDVHLLGEPACKRRTISFHLLSIWFILQFIDFRYPPCAFSSVHPRHPVPVYLNIILSQMYLPSTIQCLALTRGPGMKLGAIESVSRKAVHHKNALSAVQFSEIERIRLMWSRSCRVRRYE